MLEVKLPMAARAALVECRCRGLVMRRAYPLPGHPGGRHWHFGLPARSGTLELSVWDDEVWAKVHPLRDGGWARAVVCEMADGTVASPADVHPGRAGS